MYTRVYLSREDDALRACISPFTPGVAAGHNGAPAAGGLEYINKSISARGKK